MKKKFIYFSIFILLCLLPFTVNGEDKYYKNTATTGAQFLKIGISPRAAALGDAFSAIANDSFAPLYNPAGLGYIYQSELEFMHSEWLAGTQYEYLSYVSPGLWGCLGINVLYFHMPEMDRITDGVLGNKIQVAEGMASLSYGKTIFDFLSFGFNIKAIQSGLDTQKAAAYAGDFGILIKTIKEEFALSVVGQNFGTKLKYPDSTKEFSLPETVRAGIAFKLDLPSQYTLFRLAAEVAKSVDSDYVASVGLENVGAGVFSLRVGYVYPLSNHKLDPIASIRGGLGLNINGLLIDYAYTPFGSMEYTHRASVGFRFVGWQTGKKKAEQSVGIVADPDNISPNADNIKETANIFIFLNNVKEVKSWRLEIIGPQTADKKAYVIKTLAEDGDTPLSLQWDGFNELSKLVPEGKYKLAFEIVNDKNKKLVAPETFVTVDLTPPELQMRISTGSFSPDADKINDSLIIYPKVTESNGIGIWQISISSVTQPDKFLKIISSTKTVPSQIEWIGDDESKHILSNGRYIVQFTVEDKAGNRDQKSATVEIQVLPIELKVELSTPGFSPDGDGINDNLSFRLSAVPAQRISKWAVAIFTAAGKNVRKFASTGKPEDAAIVWDGTDDYYNAVVPNGKYLIRFGVIDYADNRYYLEKEVMVSVPGKIVEKEAVRIKDAVIREEETGTVIQIMADLLFEAKSKTFKTGSSLILDDVVKELKKSENNILIEGYADSVGTDEEALSSSSERAWTVFSYLVNSGIDKDRLTAKGRGKEKPVSSNRTVTGRALNRRIEIVILK